MVFSSIDFIFKFLPIFLIVYYIVPRRFKNLALLIGSLVFYAWGEGLYLLILLLSLLLNFIFSKQLGRNIGQFSTSRDDAANDKRRRKMWIWIAAIFNFGMLIFFKYLGFITENINLLFSHTSFSIPVVSLALPLGISFYTFQIMSYQWDIYRQEQKPARDIITMGTYLCMFPQLVAGPIITYHEVSPQLYHRNCSITNLEKGLKTFILGLGSKVLLANTMSTLWASMSRYGYESLSCANAWLGAYSYSFEIYFDFFGYSMMAIGLGQMIGLTIPKNFDHPYISGSMSEFWRRWHMTLGNWFRKYIYFPLGGSHCSTGKIIRNNLIVWAFTGLWHGASWNFVLWGLIFFVLTCLERFWYGKYLEKTHVIKHLYIIILIPLTWIVFAVTDMHEMGIYFSRLFPFFGTSADYITINDFLQNLKDYWYILLACIVFSLPHPWRWFEKHQNHPVVIILLLAIFGLSMYQLHTCAENPFLYFRF